MTQARPQTKIIEINELIVSLRKKGRYVSKDNFEWKRIERECQLLIKIEPAEGYSMLAEVMSLTGDLDGVERCFDNAKRLSGSAGRGIDMATVKAYLGQFSDCARLFEEFGSPTTGTLSNWIQFVGGIGAFQLFSARFDEATGINMQLKDSETADILLRAAALLAEAGISDKAIACHMDAAGVVLRRHGLFPSYRLAVDRMDGVFTGVTNLLGVQGTPEDIFELNVELAQEEDRIGVIKNSMFDVVFAKAPNELPA